jgi:hypothetical protein
VPIGSGTITKTVGIVFVARFTSHAERAVTAMMASTF